MNMSTVGDNLNYNVNRETGEVTEVHNDMTYAQRQKDLELQEEARKRKLKEDKNSPFTSFFQTNTSNPSYGIARRKLMRDSPIAAQVWDFLTEKANKYNAVVCSSKVLEEALGYKRTSISNAVKILKDRNFVDVKKSGTTNVYLLNKQLVWKSWGKNYKYAEFDSKVIISESEQEKEKPTKVARMDVIEMKERK